MQGREGGQSGEADMAPWSADDAFLAEVAESLP